MAGGRASSLLEWLWEHKALLLGIGSPCGAHIWSMSIYVVFSLNNWAVLMDGSGEGSAVRMQPAVSAGVCPGNVLGMA